MLHSWDMPFFDVLTHSTNFESCDIIMSITTWRRTYFLIYILNHKLGGLGTKTRPPLISQTTVFNQKQVRLAYSFLHFWRCALRQSKIVNIIKWKLAGHIILGKNYTYSEICWSVFSLNAGKYRPEKPWIRTLFT